MTDDSVGKLTVKRGKALGVENIIGEGKIAFNAPDQGTNITTAIPNKRALR